MTTFGDIGERINYAFNVYDSDLNEYLDKKEVLVVLKAMMHMLGNLKFLLKKYKSINNI